MDGIIIQKGEALESPKLHREVRTGLFLVNGVSGEIPIKLLVSAWERRMALSSC